ncbi:MAG: hypothetical protein IPK74_28870 [Deltaproteobacteria bacterium]|nr:hypothetical protein [Deltaproteobacteria bacterium]
MLVIEDQRTIGDVTVYRDDAIWYRYYMVPREPRLARDAEGRPKFTLYLYHFDDAARAADPSLPPGAGYMSLETEFAVTPDRQAAIALELQPVVDAEYARRRADPAFAGRPEYAQPTAPRVELAAPQLSSGTVTMRTTNDERLVTARFAEAPASLVTGSVAAFSLDLTDAGASFMKQTMIKEDGSGRTDATPITVEYDLKMWARLPPVEVTVTGHSERIHETLLEISQSDRDDPCTPDEVETYRDNGISSAKLRDLGLVDVQVNARDATVPAEVVTALQQYALDLFDTMIQSRFLEPAEADASALEFGPDDPGQPGQRDAGWAAILYEHRDFGGRAFEVSESLTSLEGFNDVVSSLKLRPGHRATLYQHNDFGGTMRQFSANTPWVGGDFNDVASSVKIWRPPTTRYKVRKTINSSQMDLKIRVQRSQVVEWPTGAVPGILQSAFASNDAEAMRRHVVDVTLSDFQTLRVDVLPIVDFANSPFAAVLVELSYDALDADGRTHHVGDAHRFTAAAPSAWRFDPAIVGGVRAYQSRYQIIYDDGTTTEFTPWERQTTRALTIAIADPGRIDLELSGASLNWQLLRSVVVKLSCPDPTSPDAMLSHTFELTAAQAVRKWERRVNKPLAGEITVSTTYMLADEKVIEGASGRTEVSNTLFVVPPPQVDILDVTLVPAGDWSEVAQCVVTLEYEAGEGVVYDKVARLTGMDQLVQWQVLLKDPRRRSFRYKALITYKTGNVDDAPWQTLEGDQAIPIRVAGVPKLKINVLPNLVDFTRTPAVMVALAYGDERKTLSFTSAAPQSFTPPLRPDGVREFTYQITWHPADGAPIEGPVQRTSATEVFVPKATLPQSGKLEVIVRGFAIDFAATPFVDVVLRWRDVDREESIPLALSQAEPNAKWTVDIGDRTQRRYSYAITYNLADGTRVPGKSGETDDPVISVTKYQPA